MFCLGQKSPHTPLAFLDLAVQLLSPFCLLFQASKSPHILSVLQDFDCRCIFCFPSSFFLLCLWLKEALLFKNTQSGTSLTNSCLRQLYRNYCRKSKISMCFLCVHVVFRCYYGCKYTFFLFLKRKSDKKTEFYYFCNYEIK